MGRIGSNALRNHLRQWAQGVAKAIDKVAIEERSLEPEDERIVRARTDAAAFCEYVLRDEETGQPIVLGPEHIKWHRLIDEHDRLVLWSHVEAGKTAGISIGRTLYEIGKDTTLRAVVVSNTASQANKISSTAGKYISDSEEFRNVFPQCRPGHPWNSKGMTVIRSTFSKDPTLQSCGLHGNILGARIDLLVLDDVLDHENTRNEEVRQDTLRWIRSTLFGRLTRRARVIIVGNAWNVEDAMHEIAKQPRYAGVRCPVMNRETGELAWPAHWPLERIHSFAEDLGTEAEAERQLFCVARSDGEERFKQEWIDVALELGADYDMMDKLDSTPDGFYVYHGVDLSTGKKDRDLTVIFSILVHPNGRRQILNLEVGRWAGPDIVAKIEDVHHRFGGLFVVEDNATQVFLIQFANEETAALIKAFTTTIKNKLHPLFGVESIAAEMAKGSWIIPSEPIPEGRRTPNGPTRQAVDAEVREWIVEMKKYTPATHTGDRLMAAWLSRSAAKALEVREQKKKRGEGGMQVRSVG